MKLPFIAFIAAMLALCSCSSTPFIGSLSPQAGKRQAQRDFSAGKPKIYEAGGFATYEPGIEENQKALVAKLPRDSSLAGDANNKALHSDGYATAYNKEIIFLMKSGHHR